MLGRASRKQKAFVYSFAFVFEIFKAVFSDFFFNLPQPSSFSSSLFSADICFAFPYFKLGTARTLINEMTDIFFVFSLFFKHPLRKCESSFLSSACLFQRSLSHTPTLPNTKGVHPLAQTRPLPNQMLSTTCNASFGPLYTDTNRLSSLRVNI